MNKTLDLLRSVSQRVRVPNWVYQTAILVSLLWLLVWSSVGFSPALESGCRAETPWVRGVYHFHPVAHDNRDRSTRAQAAVDSMCLDFAISTNHGGIPAKLFKHPKQGSLLIEGAEWRVAKGHHHGQIEQGPSAFRVLNHPIWTGITGVESLTDEELGMIKSGNLAMEVLNATRLLKTPRNRSTVAASLLVGPGDVGHFFAALSEPGHDVDLWVALQRELDATIPLMCGIDAHGDLSDYAELFPVSVLYLPPPAEGQAINAQWVEQEIAQNHVLCVNEYMGVVPYLRTGVCGEQVMLEFSGELPAGSQWRLFRDGEQIETGTGSAVVSGGVGRFHVELWRRVDFGLILGAHERLWAIGAVPTSESCEL